MTQEERWNEQYQELLQFITEKKRRPSKHIGEERPLCNWIKYNKKCIASGRMSKHRTEKFETLMSLAADVRRLNQYAYGYPRNANPALAKEQDLFA